MKKQITLYWLPSGGSSVKVYKPGIDEVSSAPKKGSLVLDRHVEAVAVAAVSECFGFIMGRVRQGMMWDEIAEDPGAWIKRVAESEGDPLPAVKAWIEDQLPQAILEWEQEQREQVMAALSGLNA